MKRLRLVIVAFVLVQRISTAREFNEEPWTSTNYMKLLPKYPHCGADDEDVKLYPWHAIIYLNNDHILCGGSLINTQFILTAAQCFNARHSISEYNVEFRSEIRDASDCDDSEECEFAFIVPLQKIIPHPNYSKWRNDIAIAKLKRKIFLSPYLMPICLTDENMVRDSVNLLLPFFNKQSNNVVKQFAIMNTIPSQDSKTFSAKHNLISTEQYKGNIGSGGIIDGTFLAGILLNGSSSTVTRNTSRTTFSIFTNVYQYKSWIEEVVKSESF